MSGDLSVRLPRLPRVVGQVEREQRRLPWAAPRLPIPAPLARGVPGEGHPFSWSVHRRLDGPNATPDHITDPRRSAVEPTGFFTVLQGIDASGGPPPEWSNGFRGVPLGDERDSATVETRVRPRIAALEGQAVGLEEFVAGLRDDGGTR